MNTAVRGLNVHSAAFPAFARQRNVYTAIGRSPLNVAGKIGKIDTAINRFEFDAPVYRHYRESAVVSLQRKIGRTRNGYLIRNRIIVFFGSLCLDHAGSVDPY